jgi:hypothetical protein
MLRCAVEWKWLDLLPAKMRQRPESRGRIVALTDDECDRLMAAAIKPAA